MYQYKAKCVRVVDGDTMDVEIDLGFEIRHKVRVRLLEVDAPETRTKDLEEKKRGIIIKNKVVDYINSKIIPYGGDCLTINTSKTGKYGRWLAVVFVGTDSVSLNSFIDEWIAELK